MTTDGDAPKTSRHGGWSEGQVAIAEFLLAGLAEEASRAEEALARGDTLEVQKAVVAGTRLLLRLEQLYDAVVSAHKKPNRAAGSAMLLGAVHGARLRTAGLRAAHGLAASEAAAV